MPSQTVLPRWRGFNLTNMFPLDSDGGFVEEDFQLISELGFDFVRLPLCYLLWVQDRRPEAPYNIYEPALEQIDQAVLWGRRYGIHVNLNFHRGPGYCVNRQIEEKFDLWSTPEGLDAFRFHWQLFARRYRGIPSRQLSFNLINEPPKPVATTIGRKGVSREDHARVIRATMRAIRETDPDRLIIIDGLDWATEPCPELSDTKLPQSCRAYVPAGLTHYQAGWAKGIVFRTPTWPMAERPADAAFGDLGDHAWDRPTLEAWYQRWADLAAQGVGVHCGEGGSYKFTSHAVVLAWMRDVLEILQSHNIGWALWGFRGGFGIMDSDRADVAYEEWRGHKLDRQLLGLLQAH